MRHHRILTILLIMSLAIIVQSCRTTKNVKQTTNAVKKDSSQTYHSEKKDSVRIVEKIIYVPVTSDVNLGNLCDSLGNLRPINITTNVGNYKAIISTLNNKLQINIAQLDTIFSRNEFLEVNNKKKDSVNKSLLLKIEQTQSTNKTTHLPTKWTYIFLLWAIIATALLVNNIFSIFKRNPFK